MKRIAIMIGLGLCLALPSWMAAQEDHGEVGVFADYLRFAPATSVVNFVGVGGRVGVNVRPTVSLEAEMSYDFKRNYTNAFSNGVTTVFANTGIRPITGLFGPKFQNRGPVKVFVTGKVGFINFSETNGAVVSGSAFSNSVSNIGGPGTHVAVYPGGGIEGFLGPVGLRLEAGDEIYVANGAHNNLKVTFGPHIRF
jgi:hypothetical protein